MQTPLLQCCLRATLLLFQYVSESCHSCKEKAEVTYNVNSILALFKTIGVLALIELEEKHNLPIFSFFPHENKQNIDTQS